MPPSIEDRLTDILTSIIRIELVVSGKTLAEFQSDIISRAAAERFLEIVCEASRKLPDDLKQQASHIPWRQMIDFGNILRHAYHTTKTELVWEIINNDLPALKVFVEDYLRRAKQ
ncbi:MAG: HepT-like ribonuclease domain-containing protein [Xanthobacteraceae bacterium]